MDPESRFNASCQVFGFDATGHHALVSCPRFGRLARGQLTQLTQLPPGSGPGFAAAW